MIAVFVSCGLREDNESYENPVIDTWHMEEIRCYDPDIETGNRLEKYVIPTTLTVEMKFSPKVFNYAVTETGNVTNCITSAEGSYELKFTNSLEGKVVYKKLSLSTGCNVEINEQSSGLPISMPFGLSALSDDISNIYWTINDEDKMILQLSTGFFGSSENSLCDEYCYCYGTFKKKSN